MKKKNSKNFNQLLRPRGELQMKLLTEVKESAVYHLYSGHNPREIAYFFCKYFTNIGPNLAG